jgi:hypothetical protein
MGNLCSKSSTHTGGHTLIDPAGPRRPTYGAGRVPPDVDARQAAAQAAENRLKAVSRYLPKSRAYISNFLRNNIVA